MNKFLEDRFGYDEVKAGYVSALPTLICTFISPIEAVLVDKYGYRSMWLITSFVCGTIS